MDVVITVLTLCLVVLGTIGSFCLLVSFHELGHFIAARLCGVSASSFGVGFGRKIWGRVLGDVEYRINWIPLGGYVSVLGMADEREAEIKKRKLLESGASPARVERLFAPKKLYYNQPGWKQAVIVAAGPFASFVLAFMIYTAIMWSVGRNEWRSPIEVQSVREGSAAALAGIRKGDVILAIQGRETPDSSSFDKARVLLMVEDPAQLTLVVRREGDRLTLRGPWPKNRPEGEVLGAECAAEHISMSFAEAMLYTLHSAKSGLSLQGSALSGPNSHRSVSGPLGIFRLIGKMAQRGPLSLLYVTAVLSAAVGLMNILPIPPLDGGMCIFALYKMVTKRESPLVVRNATATVGVLVLLVVLVVATSNDLRVLFG